MSLLTVVVKTYTGLILALPSPANAWGSEGHRIVADVAMDHLSHLARQNLRELLGDNDLASIATWADDIKSGRPETKPWHYVNIPSSADSYLAQRDCVDGDCVVVKITEFAATVGDTHKPLATRQEALKFLVHFVGDIHQPFHAIADARGGNGVPVEFFGSTQCGYYACELHGVWDTDLIKHTGIREHRYAAALETMIAEQHLQAGADAPEQWTNEPLRLAKAAWVEPGAVIDEAYCGREQPIVDRRLALAGLRLAQMLNAEVGTGL